MPEKGIDLSVERVGNKILFTLDPQAVARNGSCCNCNSHAVDLAALGALASEKLRTTPTKG